MRQLTQAVFDNAPDWVKSAAVDNDGKAYFYSISTKKLRVDRDEWQPPKDGDFFGACDRIGFSWTKFDTTNWQNSAIDREVK